MTSGRYRFERFVLDTDDRQLTCDDAPVDLNARYLDALAMLVREQGKLVSKDRLLDEVWRGVPVTDEAITQCIRTLRRQLGDDATRPRFIETVVKHGYRFIAPVEPAEAAPALRTMAPQPALDMPAPAAPAPAAGAWWHDGFAGTLGGAVAGVAGGLIYGFAVAAQPVDGGLGAVSVLLVIVCMTTVIAGLGGAGVSFGMAAAHGRPPLWRIAGGAAGGGLVGAVVKMIGFDAFSLLLGQTPGDVTGAPEGALLGASVGLGAWLTGRVAHLRLGIWLSALAGALGGMLITWLGGHTLAGSLVVVLSRFPNSRLHLERMWALFGESGFGPVSATVTSGLEGALFGGCIVGIIALARRQREQAGRG